MSQNPGSVFAGRHTDPVLCGETYRSGGRIYSFLSEVHPYQEGFPVNESVRTNGSHQSIQSSPLTLSPVTLTVYVFVPHSTYARTTRMALNIRTSGDPHVSKGGRSTPDATETLSYAYSSSPDRHWTPDRPGAMTPGFAKGEDPLPTGRSQSRGRPSPEPRLLRHIYR